MQRIILILIAILFVETGLVAASDLPSQELTVGAGGSFTSLRTALEQARTGDTIWVDAGRFPGNVDIRKSVTLLGENQPVIDGKGQGTVVTVRAPAVTIRGFTIRNSGKSLSAEDAGILVQAPGAQIENNRIQEVLFGVYLKQADSSIVRDNIIEGKEALAVPRRGDLIRAWYSNHLLIETNTVRYGRDVIIWFSENSIIRANKITNARYGLHFMYSTDCRIEENILTGNSVGAYLMYSRRLKVVYNTFAYNRGASGFGIGLKDIDDARLLENLVVDNRTGIFVDNSPREIESTMTYRGNVIAFNDVGMNLLSYIRRSELGENSYIENYQQVAIGGNRALEEGQFNYNYWSDYAGFDRQDDGLGDIPYKSQKLFENIIGRNEKLRLLVYSPVIQAIEFASRAFPVVKPQPRFVDRRPRMSPYFPANVPSLDLPTRLPLLAAALGLFTIGMVMILFLSSKKNSPNPERAGPSDKRRQKRTSGEEQEKKPMIQINRVTKKFGKLTAVLQLNLNVNQGEAVALWGSNGAGKTTVLRCLLGVLPFQGTICVDGMDVNAHGKAVRRRIGFVPQEISFHDNLNVAETLDFYARIKKTGLESIRDWLNRLELGPQFNKTVKELSGGMKQRLALAIALLGNPPILLLDEPTANLDMKSRDDFISLLYELKRQGKTILFSSHRLEEVTSFADRVILMDQGKLVAESAPGDVHNHLDRSSFLRLFVDPEKVETAISILQEKNFTVSQNGAGIKVQVEAGSKGQPISILAESGIPVHNFEYDIENSNQPIGKAI